MVQASTDSRDSSIIPIKAILVSIAGLLKISGTYSEEKGFRNGMFRKGGSENFSGFPAEKKRLGARKQEKEGQQFPSDI